MEKLGPRILQITFKKSILPDKVQQNIQERVHHGLQDDINKVNTQSVKDEQNKINKFTCKNYVSQ